MAQNHVSSKGRAHETELKLKTVLSDQNVSLLTEPYDNGQDNRPIYIDKNYRNYSILSKVVKEGSAHQKAIESSLKVMQEAQRAIQFTINTTETSRTGVFSGR
jgi:hypothetical protein